LYNNKTVSAIILIAGSSTRFDGSINKNLLEINNKPIFLYSLETLTSNKYIDNIIVVVRTSDEEIIQSFINKLERE